MDTFWFVLHGMLVFLMIGVITFASVVCYLARDFDSTEAHSHFVSGSRKRSYAAVPTGGKFRETESSSPTPADEEVQLTNGVV